MMQHRPQTDTGVTQALLTLAGDSSIRIPEDGEELRVLVCGGRDYKDKARVFEELKSLLRMSSIHIIHGGCPTGADQYADEFSDQWYVPSTVFKADWKRFGRSAGPRRNQRMIDEGKPDLVLAFPGGRGTADMLARALTAGVAVKRIY